MELTIGLPVELEINGAEDEGRSPAGRGRVGGAAKADHISTVPLPETESDS